MPFSSTFLLIATTHFTSQLLLLEFFRFILSPFLCRVDAFALKVRLQKGQLCASVFLFSFGNLPYFGFQCQFYFVVFSLLALIFPLLLMPFFSFLFSRDDVLEVLDFLFRHPFRLSLFLANVIYRVGSVFSCVQFMTSCDALLKSAEESGDELSLAQSVGDFT